MQSLLMTMWRQLNITAYPSFGIEDKTDKPDKLDSR